MPSPPVTAASTAATVTRLHTFSSVPPAVPPRPTASRAAPPSVTFGSVANQPTPLRDRTNTIAGCPDASLEDDAWGSDFDDVAYTETELAEFNVRFAREALDIANAQRHWFAPPTQERVNRD